MNEGQMEKIMQRYWGIKKIPHDKRTREFVRASRSHDVELDGKRYVYYRQGTGATVLCVHGLHSHLGSMVPIAQDLLAQGFQVVLFDAPAHGEAPGTSTDPVEVRRLMRKIAQEVKPIDAIICHSLGGVWTLCSWNEECRANRLISIASPATHRFLVEKFVEMYQFSDRVAARIAEELETRFGKAVWTDFSPSGIVKTIGVPGLIIHGKEDDFVPAAHAEQLRSNWTQAKVEIVDGVSHFDAVISPQVRGLIARYLSESL